MAKKPALADKPFGVVPQNVMRDTTLSVQERWLYALLCTHADDKGCCRRSLEAIAGEAGVKRRAVQRWLLGLETRGFVCKLNEVGKMGVYQIIRHKCRRGAAQMKNVRTVATRMVRFSAFGKKGATAREEKRKERMEPVYEETPPRVRNDTGTGVSEINPEHDSLTRLSEQERKNGRAALPPGGGGASLKKKEGLQGGDCDWGLAISTGVSTVANAHYLGKRGAMEQRLAEKLGWPLVMAACDPGDENHERAVKAYHREAALLGVSFK